MSRNLIEMIKLIIAVRAILAVFPLPFESPGPGDFKTVLIFFLSCIFLELSDFKVWIRSPVVKLKGRIVHRSGIKNKKKNN